MGYIVPNPERQQKDYNLRVYWKTVWMKFQCHFKKKKFHFLFYSPSQNVSEKNKCNLLNY